MTRIDRVSGTAAAMVANAELAARTAGDIQLMGELMGVPTTLIDGWRAQASARHDPLLDSLLPGVAEVVNRGETDAAALMGLAEQCRQVVVSDDTGVLRAELDRIAELARQA